MTFVLEPSVEATIFWLATLAWALEWRFFPSIADHGRDARGRIEALAMAAAIVGSFGLTAWCHARGWGNLEGSAANLARAVALTLYVLGIGLRYWAAACLGAWFTRRVDVEPDQTLVSHGPYRVLRHPLYVGLLAAATGLLLLFANLPGPLIGVPLLILAIGVRVRREEALLTEGLFGAYETWARKRLRLLPRIF